MKHWIKTAFLFLFSLNIWAMAPIVAIGDLHGDYPETLRLLRKAEIIDEGLNWNGKNSILVQLIRTR